MTEQPPVDKPTKKAARPGSAWATGQRKSQKRLDEPKGFARGARVK